MTGGWTPCTGPLGLPSVKVQLKAKIRIAITWALPERGSRLLSFLPLFVYEREKQQITKRGHKYQVMASINCHCVPAVLICRWFLKVEWGNCDILFVGIVGILSVISNFEECRILLLREWFKMISIIYHVKFDQKSSSVVSTLADVTSFLLLSFTFSPT